MKTRRKERSGFTLVEVIISLALFSIAITSFSASYFSIVTAIEAVQVDQSLEQDVAMFRQIALFKETVEELEDGGQFQSGSNGIVEWRGEIEPTQVADLFQVTLTLDFPDHGEKEAHQVQQTLYLTRPTWSEPVDRESLRAETRDRLLERQQGLR